MVDAGGRCAAEGWRRMEAPPEGADLVPLDRYDAARAKIAANLQWICAKAYGLEWPHGDGGCPDDGLHCGDDQH
uniref:Calmodulin regulated spectrin-associated protein 1 n=1 Tax=Mus musculus TaxID=10090 RepID=V9GXT0_MOUSE